MNPTLAVSLPRNIFGGEVHTLEMFGLNFFKLLGFLSLLIVFVPDENHAFSEISGSSLPRSVSTLEVLI